MKTFLSLLMTFAVLSLWALQTKPQSSMDFNADPIDGKKITLKKGCTLCHNPEKVIVGPSFKDISKAYKGDKEKILAFLSGESKPIVNPEEFQYMKPVLNQLNHSSKEERDKIAQYIASLK